MLIRDGAKSRPDNNLEFISSDEVDDVLEDPEWSLRYEPVQGLIFETHDISMDPTLSEDRQRTSGDLGILTVAFSPWEIGLNWDTHWNEGIPPHHYRVRYHGDEVAIMSPYMLFRTCPYCKLGDPTINGKFDPRGLYLAHYCPTNPVTGDPTDWRVSACAPAHACRGAAYDGKLLNTCRGYDWFGSGLLLGSEGLEPADVFQRDCAEELAARTNKDRYATEMAQPDNLESLNQASDVAPDGQESRIVMS